MAALHGFGCRSQRGGIDANVRPRERTGSRRRDSVAGRVGKCAQDSVKILIVQKQLFLIGKQKQKCLSRQFRTF